MNVCMLSSGASDPSHAKGGGGHVLHKLQPTETHRDVAVPTPKLRQQKLFIAREILPEAGFLFKQ
jgi:hypothetical protein